MMNVYLNVDDNVNVNNNIIWNDKANIKVFVNVTDYTNLVFGKLSKPIIWFDLNGSKRNFLLIWQYCSKSRALLKN